MATEAVKTAADILRAAKARIENPEKWCQRTPYSYDRTRMCAKQAFGITGGNRWPQAQNALAMACLEMGHVSVVALNDSTDHATVMRMFDRAIELAEGQS